MQKFLALVAFIALIKPAQGQNSFSFNCAKDTTIQCTTSCLTLQTIIPDIHSSTSSYTINQISALSCFRPYIDPSAPGSPANLTIDDRYSPVIDITFPFSFFGNSYNKLIASTNGFLSFDISKTGAFSHFGILNNGGVLSSTTGVPQDLPSALYDKALIMGPYHDLDPNNTTATEQIKYDVVGTAPYRKWILSYYNVPLYTTACLNLSKNTHQIVLYETLGIVEVFIFDKEICVNWNNGRAMIGMQDMNKSAAIMAPGRQASSAPWGSKGIDESWRFVPASGQRLFKRVELYTLSGTFVTAGNTTPAANNLLSVDFPNICPPSTGQTYIVKSFYQNPVDVTTEIVSTDTINVLRGDPIGTNIIPAKCSQGSKGTITVTSPVGPAYEYSIDGVNWQLSNVFIELPGSYLIRTRIIGTNCISSKSVFVNAESFNALIQTNVTPCPGPVSGSLTIFPSQGTPPYLYSLNGGPFQTSNVFLNLSEGIYKVLVTDAGGCSYAAEVELSFANLASTLITNTVCGNIPSGSIAAFPAFGTPPYTYSINGGPFQNSNIFPNLAVGNYTITIKDITSCSFSLVSTVNADTRIVSNPSIILPTCNGSSDGSIILNPSLGKSPYQYAINSSSYQDNNIFNNLAAGSYAIHIKDSVGCIKDTIVTVLQPNVVGETIISVPASTCFSNDGQLTVKANGGTTPYVYSLDSGLNYQSSNIFNVAAGQYTITVKDIHGCISSTSALVTPVDNSMKVDLGPDKTICQGSSITIIPNTVPKATSFKWSPATSLNDSTSATPVATPFDTTTYILNATSEVCKGTDTITVNVLHKPFINAGADTIICYNTSALLHSTVTNLSGPVKYLWLPSTDLVTPNSPSTIAKPRDIGTHTYQLQVSDNYGCNFRVYDDVIVTMVGPVRAFAGNDTVATMGIPHQLYGTGGIQYFWSPAAVLDTATKQNPIAILQNDTRFFLIVKDTLGCTGTSTVLVKVYKDATYYLPNAFTPNHDGLNDVFKGVAPGIQKTDYFRVFNRLGQLIFQSQDVTKGWDGTYLGTDQPAAVYVWMVRGLDKFGKIIQQKGTVTLIR